MKARKPSGEVEKVAEQLKKFDADTVLAAIKEASVDYNQVDEVKKMLSKYDSATIQCAMTELHAEKTNVEIKNVREVIDHYGIENIKEAAVYIGYANRNALCMNGIDCSGSCVMVMIGRCQQEMVAVLDKGQLVQQNALELIISKAVKEAARLGEV